MKKLSAIIAFALIITIGGVYAAWHYNRGEVSLELTRSATMASVQSDTSKGSISIDQTANSGQGNTLKFLVDDIGATDWKAELVTSGSVWVKFTPAANADADVQREGIALKATITVVGPYNAETKTYGTPSKYTDPYNSNQAVTIFQAKEGANSFILNDGNKTKDTSLEITAEQIASCLDFNVGAHADGLFLKTYDDNVAYETAMKTYLIMVTITEYVPAA